MFFSSRCAQCYQCPSCHNTLSTRILLQQVPNPANPSENIPRKLAFYYCYLCRWTSRDIGMPDQTVCKFFF